MSSSGISPRIRAIGIRFAERYVDKLKAADEEKLRRTQVRFFNLIIQHPSMRTVFLVSR